MAKELTFKINSKVYSLVPKKLERKKLYGSKEKQVLDGEGTQCSAVSLCQELSMVIPKGGTSLGTLDENNSWVEKNDIKYVYADGNDAIIIPSSFDSVIDLSQTMCVEDFLEHNITSTYLLQSEEPYQDLIEFIKKMKNIAHFIFNYRADYEGDPAFLIENGGQLFILVGKKIEFEFIGLNDDRILDNDDVVEEAIEEDEFDFSMM